MAEIFHMKIIVCHLYCVLMHGSVWGASFSPDTIRVNIDSTWWQGFNEQQLSESQAILINEQERPVASGAGYASPLFGEKDVFHQIAAFQFGSMRFRPKGYDASFFHALINGLMFNQVENGNPPWALWGGLSSMMRVTQEWMPVRYQEHWMGGLGNTVHTDMRATFQRKQWQFAYGISNRSWRHRYQLSYAGDINKKGWSIALHAGFRHAEEGYKTASVFRSVSYYVAIDKTWNNKHLVSLILFGNDQIYGKQAAITMPVFLLMGRKYNPSWGYQNGIKRNAALGGQHQPVLILTHETRSNNQTVWINSLGLICGQKFDTGLDWFNAADPRPDYYRYLPNYQSDSVLRNMVGSVLQEDEYLQQIDWHKLYDINRNNHSVIHDANGTQGLVVSGKQARYLLEKRVAATKKVLFSSHVQTRFGEHWSLSGGMHIRLQKSDYYKKVHDLLGADFHVNWNQFAENELVTDTQVQQFDLDRPNRILRVGDKYGYDYAMYHASTDAWLQAEYKGRKVDQLIGLHVNKTNFYRKGNVRNGLFPGHSFGAGRAYHFLNAHIRSVTTYKINGRQSVLCMVSIGARPPLFDQVYISPRMRNTTQEQVVSEQWAHIEGMYRYVSPKLHLRVSVYHTNLLDGMDVITFYHDGYRNFVNDAIGNIDRSFTGIETGMTYSLSEHWQFTVAFAAAVNHYTSRQQVTVSLDNNEWLLDRMEVYSKYFRLAGSPQQVLGTGMQYRSGSLFVQLNWNYFHHRWIDMNPVRRTYEALNGVQEGSILWRKIVDQAHLPPATSVNFFIGKGFTVRPVKKAKPLRYYCTLSIQNLLNRQDMVTGGYEQLRFDQDTKNPDKFPPKLFFGYGLNYSLGISVSL